MSDDAVTAEEIRDVLVAQQAQMNSLGDTIQRLEAEVFRKGGTASPVTEREIAESRPPKPTVPGSVGNDTTKIPDTVDQGKKMLHAALASMDEGSRKRFMSNPDMSDSDRKEAMDHFERSRDRGQREEAMEEGNEGGMQRRAHVSSAEFHRDSDEAERDERHKAHMASLEDNGRRMEAEMGFNRGGEMVATAGYDGRRYAGVEAGAERMENGPVLVASQLPQGDYIEVTDDVAKWLGEGI